MLAIKAGLDVEQVVGALNGGAAQSWVLANRSGRMLDNDYPLGFKVALHRKDLGIALDLAAQLGAVLPVSALAAQLETGLIAGGHADEDMSALARTIRSPLRPRRLTQDPNRKQGPSAGGLYDRGYVEPRIVAPDGPAKAASSTGSERTQAA